MAKCLLLSALLVLSVVCSVSAGPAECSTCKVLIGQVEAWLASNATETWIENELNSVCAILPTDLKIVCESLVAQVPTLIAQLEAKETPAVICAALGMCSKTPVKTNGVLVCDTCQFLMGAIEGWVESNKTVTEIEDLLDQLCSYLGVMESVCDRIVQVGIEDIIAWINNNESPAQICAQIGLCPSSSPVPAVPVGTWECETCKVIVGAVEGWVLSNKTVSEIEGLLDELCALLGSSVEPVCDMIVKIGVESVVAWIEANENPTEICTQLLLCQSSKPKPMDDLWCETCHVVIAVVEEWVESNKTIAEIEELIDQLCELLPTSLDLLCEAMVDTGIHKIIEWINNDETPEIICQQLGMCSSVNKLLPAIKPVF